MLRSWQFSAKLDSLFTLKEESRTTLKGFFFLVDNLFPLWGGVDAPLTPWGSLRLSLQPWCGAAAADHHRVSKMYWRQCRHVPKDQETLLDLNVMDRKCFFSPLPYFQDDATQRKKKSPYFLSKCFYLHKSACCLPELCVWLSNANITCQLRMLRKVQQTREYTTERPTREERERKVCKTRFLTFPLICKTLWRIFSRRLHAETSHFSPHFTIQTSGCTLFKITHIFYVQSLVPVICVIYQPFAADGQCSDSFCDLVQCPFLVLQLLSVI